MRGLADKEALWGRGVLGVRQGSCTALWPGQGPGAGSRSGGSQSTADPQLPAELP